MTTGIARHGDEGGGAHSLAGAGILLRSGRPGTHRTACPRCAAAKRRPGDSALSVTIEPDGRAVWKCWRCEWTGTTRAQEQPQERRPASVKPTLPPELRSRPGGLPGPAAAFWRRCLPVVPGTLAAAYLDHRACALPHVDGDLRWHPEVRHPGGLVGPALVGLLTDAVTAEPMTLHRTWIRPDGRGKAEVEGPRRWWPDLPKTGGLIRLWPDDAVNTGLCVGEGVETSLSSARGFGLAWATGDAGNLAVLPVLEGVESLTIVADHDENGRGFAAADTCTRRWLAGGKEVRVWPAPTQGTDFNDYARGAA